MKLRKCVPAKHLAEVDVEGARKGILSYLHDIVCLLAVVIILFTICFRVVVVSGPSMNDTLVNGDWLLLLSNLTSGEIQQGDIIVASKDSFKDGEPIIKRVIATEGQIVDIRGGIVYVDDKPLDEPYTLTSTAASGGVAFPCTVKSGCVFVMGDNRGVSLDSRSTEIGQIDKREIVGKAVFVLFPGFDELHPKREFGRIGVLS